MQTNSIISNLPNMSRTDLMKLRQMAELLLQGGAELKIEDQNESILFEALKSEFASQGLNSRIPYDTLRTSKYMKSWQAGCATVNAFIDKYFKKYIKTDIERSALSRILIRCLMADLKRLEIPVSLGTIARNLHRVPQAFENSFPGYLRSGLAYLIAKALIKTKNA